MTPRQTEFPSEPYFWDALKRKITAVLSGKITLGQVTSWLHCVRVDRKRLEHKRIAVIVGGLKLILFAKRGEKSR